jgi:hypothetical protein
MQVKILCGREYGRTVSGRPSSRTFASGEPRKPVARARPELVIHLVRQPTPLIASLRRNARHRSIGTFLAEIGSGRLRELRTLSRADRLHCSGSTANRPSSHARERFNRTVPGGGRSRDQQTVSIASSIDAQRENTANLRAVVNAIRFAFRRRWLRRQAVTRSRWLLSLTARRGSTESIQAPDPRLCLSSACGFDLVLMQTQSYACGGFQSHEGLERRSDQGALVNFQTHPLPGTRARDEWRLEAVRCGTVFGAGPAVGR